MKEITTADIIFPEMTAEDVKNKPFSHFGWEGVDAFAFYRMSEAYWDAAKVLLDKMKSNPNNIEIIDGLIYPLFFSYRHSLEIYLKALLFEHGIRSKEARKKYIDKSHSLEGLWEILKPYLTKGVEHVGSSISLDAVEHYILELHRFDPRSMVMRYPITLKLDPHPQREEEMRLDFMHFADCMDALCDSLRQLKYDISDQIEKEATQVEVAEFLEIYKRYKNEIDEFLLSIQEDIECRPKGKRDIGSLVMYLGDPLPEGNQSEPSYKKSLRDYEPDMLILLEILYLAGSCINERVYQLTISNDTKLNEFVQLCKDLLKSHSLSFGEFIEVMDLNVPHASPSALVKSLSTSIAILKP